MKEKNEHCRPLGFSLFSLSEGFCPSTIFFLCELHSFHACNDTESQVRNHGGQIVNYFCFSFLLEFQEGGSNGMFVVFTFEQQAVCFFSNYS